MTRAIFGWGLLALLFYLMFLLLTLPAERVAAWSKLPLTEVRGSLWAGEGTLQIGRETIQNTRWRLHPVWPWQGAFGAMIAAGHQGWQAAGELRLDWNGTLHLDDVILSGPLDSPLLASQLPLPITGQARLHIARADWREGLVKAEGVILEVFKPRIMLGEPLALGDLAAEIEVVDGRLHGRVHDKGGPLEITGLLEGEVRSGLIFEARLIARPGAPTALADNLRLLPAAPEGGARIHAHLTAPWLVHPH